MTTVLSGGKWLLSPLRHQNAWLLKSFVQNGAVSAYNLYTSSHVLKSSPGYLYLRQCKYYENSCWRTANSKFCFLELSENFKKVSILSWLNLWVLNPWATILEFLTLQRIKFFQKFLLSGLLLPWAYVCWMIQPWMDGWMEGEVGAGLGWVVGCSARPLTSLSFSFPTCKMKSLD